MTEITKVSIEVNGEGWGATFREGVHLPEYVKSQTAFEAARAVERASKK